MRIQWSDIARAARETADALDGDAWVGASIKARVLLHDLADELERLRLERLRLFDWAVGVDQCDGAAAGEDRPLAESVAAAVRVLVHGDGDDQPHPGVAAALDEHDRRMSPPAPGED